MAATLKIGTLSRVVDSCPPRPTLCTACNSGYPQEGNLLKVRFGGYIGDPNATSLGIGTLFEDLSNKRSVLKYFI